jgi:pyruvate formate lyase activating enzyme
LIPGGGFGACGARGNKGGRGLIPFYGFTSALALDPIEKKPLYHFRPGSLILSAGFAGCNMFCPFCQNYRLSRYAGVPGSRSGPEELVEMAQRDGFTQIAFTYSEPLIHAEYLVDSMTAAREAGLAAVLVSNGCVNPGVAADILPLTSAANIDLKSFSHATYAKTLGGNLEAVQDFIRMAWGAGVHLEVTTLVVPELNDRVKELEEAAAFLAGISPELPWHISAYHPAYRWKAQATASEFIRETVRRARQGLRYVYAGNISAGEADGEFTDTFCRRCGAVLVSRRGYRVDTGGLETGRGEGEPYRCRHCGEGAPFRD